MWLATDVAQRRLQDSESRFLAVFDSAPIGLAIGDFDSNILESNQALQELLGYSREELNALTGADILHPDDIPDTLQRYDRLFRGEYQSFRSRQRLLKKTATCCGPTSPCPRCVTPPARPPTRWRWSRTPPSCTTRTRPWPRSACRTR